MLAALLEQGARSNGDPQEFHAVAVDARAPKFDGGIVTRLDSVPFGIVVNRNGERFYDEGEDFWPKRYAIWGGLIARQPDQIAYSIIDADVIDKFMPSVFPPVEAPTHRRSWPTKLELDPDAVVTAVETYNRSIEPGTFDPAELDDCHTEGLDAAQEPLGRPDQDSRRSTATRCGPGITFTYMGVTVDEQARMIMHDGRRSPNMFAAGEVMAGNILGRGLPGRLRPDHRRRLRADRREGGRRQCQPLSRRQMKDLLDEADAAAHDLQRLPLLRGLLRRLAGDGAAPDVQGLRHPLPVQPLLRLPGLLLRLPVRAAARVRRQHPARSSPRSAPRRTRTTPGRASAGADGQEQRRGRRSSSRPSASSRWSLLVLLAQGPAVTVRVHVGEGSFFRVVPFLAMVAAGHRRSRCLRLRACSGIGAVRFWRDTRGSPDDCVDLGGLQEGDAPTRSGCAT